MSGERRILVIGEEAAAAEALMGATARLGIGVEVAGGLAPGLRALAHGHFVATLVSLDLPGSDAALIERIAGEPGAGAVLAITERATPRLAMEVIRAGAAELLTRPLDVESVVSSIRPLRAEAVVPFRAGGAAGEDGGALVGESPAVLEVFKAVARVGPSDATVLVTGESGTGKEVVARELHREGRGSAREFVAVNCAAIPEDLLESELFGHERGAFTGAVARKVGRFERAHGGTLFLDEIGDMSLVLQAKILRALQEREIERVGGNERIAVDVRVVAATHRDLRALIEAGEFREDLYYRLAVVRIHLPPLRERPGDVRALALHFGSHFARHHGRELRGITEPALAALEAHEWPGNVRELRNVLERAVLLSTGDAIDVGQVNASVDAAALRERDHGAGAVLARYSESLTMAEVEALHMARVLESVDGHYGRAAEVLGMHRNTVSRKAREYGFGGAGA